MTIVYYVKFRIKILNDEFYKIKEIEGSDY